LCLDKAFMPGAEPLPGGRRQGIGVFDEQHRHGRRRRQRSDDAAGRELRKGRMPGLFETRSGGENPLQRRTGRRLAGQDHRRAHREHARRQLGEERGLSGALRPDNQARRRALQHRVGESQQGVGPLLIEIDVDRAGPLDEGMFAKAERAQERIVHCRRFLRLLVSLGPWVFLLSHHSCPRRRTRRATATLYTRLSVRCLQSHTNPQRNRANADQSIDTGGKDVG